MLTNHPLGKVLADPNISGQMVNWSIELSEHGIEYRPGLTIKAQPLVDFILEMMRNEEDQLARLKDELEEYLKDGTPQDPKEAKPIRVRASTFTLFGGELYKSGFSQPYLKCINQDKMEYISREIHKGSCRNHSGGRALASKAF
ncbi:hypothetical protein Sango_2093500 [Sesamum angolense]|uniref:Uncharacterized protein n=1 Tax=Sesamum angolense TaxID=2727404 RepID=A0AAE2BM11_9LAMI|nr:hypothetical protein Sango_2093500 [Sesamum angolense]